MSSRQPDAQAVSNRNHFVQRVLITISLVTAVVLVLAFAWGAAEVLLVIFAGILLAVFLRGLGNWVSAHTPLSKGWALVAVILGLIALGGISGVLFAPSVNEQFAELTEQVPRAAGDLRERMTESALGSRLLEQAPAVDEATSQAGNLVTPVLGAFSTAFGALANAIIILFVGLYLAIDPGVYTGGLIRLIPLARRERAREVLHVLGYTLRRWLIGRILLMTVIGVLTTLGLWLIGIPLAVGLGVLAALLAFIPNIGPLIAAIPAVLLGLVDSSTTALYVIALYVGVQTIESYLFEPLVEQRTVSLPPVLVITSQVLLGLSFGALGLLLATPLFAVGLVLVKMLYVEDTLGDHEIEVLGEDEAEQVVRHGEAT